MSMRYLQLKDLFEIKCRKCGSNDIDINGEDCHECGVCINAECNNCNSKYDYHKFIQIIE